MKTLRTLCCLTLLCLVAVGIAEAGKRPRRPKPRNRTPVNLAGVWNGVAEAHDNRGEEYYVDWTLKIDQPQSSSTLNAKVCLDNPETGEEVCADATGQVNSKGKFTARGQDTYEGIPVNFTVSGEAKGNSMEGDITFRAVGQSYTAEFEATRQ